MNILDENIPESQRALLHRRRIHVRQIGDDAGRKGMSDHEIIPILHQLDRPTFFTLDSDFCDAHLCHGGYCLVHLDVDDDAAADFIQRFLRHPEMNTKIKRMGRIVRASPTGMVVWCLHHAQETHVGWK